MGGLPLAFPWGGGFCVEHHRISRPPLPVVEPGGSVLIDHAVQMLGVSRRTVYYWIRQGRLRTVRTRMGSQRVLLESIRELEYVAAPTPPAARPASAGQLGVLTS
jgi:excisionase family DNA binding protein